MKRLWFLPKNRVDLSSISEVRSYITGWPRFLAHPVCNGLRSWWVGDRITRMRDNALHDGRVMGQNPRPSTAAINIMLSLAIKCLREFPLHPRWFCSFTARKYISVRPKNIQSFCGRWFFSMSKKDRSKCSNWWSLMHAIVYATDWPTASPTALGDDFKQTF